MIQSRKLTGESEGMSLQDRTCKSETKMLGNRSHCWDKKHRVIDWDLHCLLERGTRPSFVVVVKTDYVSEKDGVKATFLGDLS
jgi:hypothetical protein